MDFLSPYQVDQVRARRVDYGDVFNVTVKRASVCRCCGEKIAKGQPALEFYWDFNGSGSWTSIKCFMHEACEPVDADLRSKVNREAGIARHEKHADKLIEKSFSASPKRRYRLEKEAARVREQVAKWKEAK